MRTDELGNPAGRPAPSHRVASDVIRIRPGAKMRKRPNFGGHVVRMLALVGSIAASAFVAGYLSW